MKHCFQCGNRLKIGEKPSRGDTCPFCDADLKTCLNCEFYDPSQSNSCAEPMADPVQDKERSNFCEYFLFRETSTETTKKPAEDPLEDLKRLFTECPE